MSSFSCDFMKDDNKEIITLAEAKEEMEVAMTRLALMHLSFSKILVDEFGKEKGRELILKAITEYGSRIGKIIKAGGRDLPKFGVHTGEVYQTEEGDYVVSGCVLAKVFKQYDELELGSLYCYVDPSKSMSADISEKLIHKTCEACGDDKCTLAIVPTSEEDKKHFNERSKDLIFLNPYIAKKHLNDE
ncbi:MAG: hypothetical protein FK733_07660 [Asgard group archaeon]|nr:hypothetical protein [Asgard group archaeon]